MPNGGGNREISLNGKMLEHVGENLLILQHAQLVKAYLASVGKPVWDDCYLGERTCVHPPLFARTTRSAVPTNHWSTEAFKCCLDNNQSGECIATIGASVVLATTDRGTSEASLCQPKFVATETRRGSNSQKHARRETAKGTTRRVAL